MMTGKRGTLEAQTGIMPIIERVAMKDVNRALDRLRKIQVRYRVVSANGAGKNSRIFRLRCDLPGQRYYSARPRKLHRGGAEVAEKGE